MSSKTFLFLSVVLALVIAISSKVAARDLAEVTPTTNTNQDQNAKTSKETNRADGDKDERYGGYPGNGGYGGYPGNGGYGGNPGRGGYGGNPGRGGNGGYPGYGGGGYCRFGCCRRSYYGDCRRCCSYVGETVESETQAQPHN